MKKSKQFSNKITARKDLLNSTTALSLILILIFGILIFYLVLIPETTPNGGTSFLVEQELVSPPIENYIFCEERETVLLLCVAGGLAIGVSQFEFLHRKKYCSTLLSFNIKRSKLFFNRLLIPLVLAPLCILLPYLISLKINIEILGFKSDILPWFFLQILTAFEAFFISYIISIITCIFTGRTIEAAAGAISVAIFPHNIFTLFDSIFDLSLFGYNGTYDSQTANILTHLDPTYISQLMYGSEFSGYAPINTPLDTENFVLMVLSIVWILLGVIVLALVKRYFSQKFKPENIGFKGTNKAIAALTSFSVPLLISLMAISYFKNQFSPIVSDNITFLVIGIGLVIGFAAAIIIGLVINFTFKKLKPALIGGSALIGAVAISLIIGITGVFGTYHTPPKAEEIAKIEIMAPYSEFFPNLYATPHFTESYISNSSTALIITQQEDIETILTLHESASKKDADTTASKFHIAYTLKDGSTIIRKYKNLSQDTTELMLKLWDTKASKELYYNCLFPKSKGAENLDNSPSSGYASMRYENPYIMDYYDEDAFLLIKTRDGETKSLLNEITEAEFINLKKAIYKDICEMTSSEWFNPKETQIGTLSFGYASYQNYLSPEDTNNMNFYINPNMKNTLKTLKALDLYKYFESKKKVEKVLVGDIKEYCIWENQGLYENHLGASIHQPLFSQFSGNRAVFCFHAEELGYSTPPLKEVSDKMQIKSLTEKGYIAYNIMNNGKIVFVKYTDETYSSYVIPYEQ